MSKSCRAAQPRFSPGTDGRHGKLHPAPGTEAPSGNIGVTWGNEGMVRVDGFYGFKIADGWYGSAGGFYRSSDGVRNPQFPADQGGQFTAP